MKGGVHQIFQIVVIFSECTSTEPILTKLPKLYKIWGFPPYRPKREKRRVKLGQTKSTRVIRKSIWKYYPWGRGGKMKILLTHYSHVTYPIEHNFEYFYCWNNLIIIRLMWCGHIRGATMVADIGHFALLVFQSRPRQCDKLTTMRQCDTMGDSATKRCIVRQCDKRRSALSIWSVLSLCREQEGNSAKYPILATIIIYR